MSTPPTLGRSARATRRQSILATTDGGTTWKVQDTWKMWIAGVNSMAFADTTHGWVVGGGGVILATTDGGNSWKRQHSGTKMNLGAVAFADATHGLAVGNRFVGADPFSDTYKGSTILAPQTVAPPGRTKQRNEWHVPRAPRVTMPWAEADVPLRPADGSHSGPSALTTPKLSLP